MYFTNRSHNQVPLATLLVIGILSAAANIFFNRQMFFDHKTFAQLEDLYARSQYVLGELKEVIIGDGDIYTYAGIRYAQGADVTSINFEHPPLAKYLYGISHNLFGIQSLVLIPMYIITPILMWILAKNLFESHRYRWLSIFILLTHTAYIYNSTQTMLDFPQMFFMLLSQTIFLKILKKPSYMNCVLFGLTVGTTWLIKYPFPLTVLLHAANILWLIIKKINLKQLIVISLSIVITYLLGYWSFFKVGRNLFDWIRFEWWRIDWYTGKTDNPSFYLLRTMFTGKFPAWWINSNSIFTVPIWNISWPVSLLFFFGSLARMFKQNNSVKIYLYWSGFAFIILAAKVTEDRHIMPLLPAFALGSSFFLKESIQKLIFLTKRS
jgi:hypothetical protein